MSSIIPPLPARPSAANLFSQQNISGATAIADGATAYWTGDFAGFRVSGSLDSAGLLWGSGANGISAVELIDRGGRRPRAAERLRS